MFKEVIEKEDEQREFDERVHKYGDMTIVSLESVKNVTVLAALTFIDISGALMGAAISIAVFIIIAINSKHIITRIPLDKLRLISGILLTIAATPLDKLFFWFVSSAIVALDNFTTQLMTIVVYIKWITNLIDGCGLDKGFVSSLILPIMQPCQMEDN